jgi:signal transduction histidine kinase
LSSAVGNPIGIAIQNSRLHEDVARQLSVQRELNRVAEQITSELDPDHVLLTVLEIAESVTGAEAGLIALFDPQSELMHYPYLHNLPEHLAGVAVPVVTGLAAEVMTTKRPILIENYPSYPRAISEFVEAGVVSIMGVPVLSGEEVFGALAVVGLSDAKWYTSSSTAILEGIGRQAGIAIQNAQLYARMRFYAREIVRAQEGERKRIARELHDDTVQLLVALMRRLEVLRTLQPSLAEAAVAHLEAIQVLLDTTLAGVRRFVQDLRPPTLDHLGLVATLEGLVADHTRVEGFSVELEVAGEARRLAPELELALFRIAQEALSNVRRHASASKVTIRLAFQAECVHMTVQDDGVGFNAPARVDEMVARGRLGLIGMYERARNLGGSLTIQSDVGRGTSVIVEVPTRRGDGDRDPY